MIQTTVEMQDEATKQNMDSSRRQVVIPAKTLKQGFEGGSQLTRVSEWAATPPCLVSASASLENLLDRLAQKKKCAGSHKCRTNQNKGLI